MVCLFVYVPSSAAQSSSPQRRPKRGSREGVQTWFAASNLRLLLLLGLEVLVTEVGSETTDQDDTVQTDTEAGRVVVGRGSRGGSGVSLGGRVAGLVYRLVRRRNGGDFGVNRGVGHTWRFNSPT